MMKKIVSLCLMAAVLSIPASAAIINDFEGVAGNAVHWDGDNGARSIDDATVNPSIYSYDSVTGVTSGSQSVHVNVTGWGQTLALRLDYAQRVDFMANSIFSIDISVPANHVNDGSGGWTEIYNVTLNTEGYGWHDQFTAPAMQFGFWDNSGVQTQTLTFDYSAAKGSMPAVPNWVEIIFATNSDGVHSNLYFDNAQVIVPEPATLSILGLGALALVRRKK